MPHPNALVARVNKLSTPSGVSDATAAAPAQGITVTFDGGSTATLPPGRRASSWQRLLEHTRQYGIPAYIEADPETGVITLVLVPMRVRVVTVAPRTDGDMDVHFIESHAIHRLLRSNPDFNDMLNALEGARAAGTAILVTATRDEHEIIDVRPAPPAPPAPSPGPAPSDAGDADEPAPGDPPSVVTEAQAIQLFNDMAATLCDPFTVPPPCIPFNFPDDGCYARAHEMIRS